MQWHGDQVADAVHDHVMARGDAVGADLASEISARTPRSSGRGHLPGGGHAADAVGHRVTDLGDAVRITVGYSDRAFYMSFREVGTSRMAAQPIVRPTVLEGRYRIVRGLAR